MMRNPAIDQLVRLALDEDIGAGDLSAYAIPITTQAVARIIAKEPCVVSGGGLISIVLEQIASDAQIESLVSDGAQLEKGQELARIRGSARKILSAERTILNFLQRLSGIATAARQLRAQLGDQSLKILDTRKTTPGFRVLEKKAVRDGGLWNHRSRLDEAVLLKENHLRAAGSMRAAVESIRREVPAGVTLQVEVTSWEEIQQAVALGVDRLLLDNFSPEELPALIEKTRALLPNVYLEASGGISAVTANVYFSLNLNAISLGSLTHSVKSVDLSMLFDF